MTAVVHKCGDINTSVSLGIREFLLSCAFCDGMFLTLEKFAKHIEDEHLSEDSEQEYSEGEMTTDLTVMPMEIEPEGQQEINKVFIDIEVLNNLKEEIEEVEEIKYEVEEIKNEAEEIKNGVEEAEAAEYTENEEEAIECAYKEECLLSESVDVDESDEEDRDSDLDCTDLETGKTDDPLKMFDKAAMTTIFTNFENHSILWNRNDPASKNIRLRSIAYKSLASDIGKLSQWKKVRDLVRKLSYRLRQELERKKCCASLDEDYTPWFLEDMDSFLKIRQEFKKYVIPPSRFKGAKFLKFIQIYRSFTRLWNENDIDYRLPNKREKAMNELEKLIVRKIGFSLTQAEIEQEIARIRKICSQEKKRKLKCEELKIAYTSEFKYYNQIKFLEMDVGPFKCEKCKEILPSLNKFKVHQSKHDGIKPFVCPLCGNKFTTVHSLNIHLNRHTGDYKYICKFCDKGFPALSELSVHERSHTGERPYFCHQCGKTFRVWVYFDSHVRRHENRPGYQCSICFKTFFGAHHLNEHVSVHRKERDQVCNICGKGFKMPKYLRQHKQIHDNEKKYICKICGKAFAQYAGLSGHMKTHGTTLVDNNNRINTTGDGYNSDE